LRVASKVLVVVTKLRANVFVVRLAHVSRRNEPQEVNRGVLESWSRILRASVHETSRKFFASGRRCASQAPVEGSN
jgi:alpha-ketoglutarate-dependent taurine dioxygenase